ncbi:MAG: carbohydrate binding family 9 domain-containing protein [Cyclobacteriaceae bacterium]|nr:carbohydrate binding family 9 domain-containing protein [Cyclobacteriaceae bacterium]
MFIRLTCLLLLLAYNGYCQKKNAGYQLNIRKTAVPVHIDGLDTDQAWSDADVATDFFMVLPMDTSRARVRTEVRMSYDNEHLYLLAINYHALPGPYMVESLRRDWEFGKNDNFLLFMDTFDDLTNGFSFGSNAAGAQWDGIMYEGGKVDLSWDNKWTSVVKNMDDRWVFEAAIPFKSIRYKKGITQWGINFSRLDLKTTEKSSWTPIPRQFPTASLAYTGILQWDAPPPAARSNISVIPYALGGVSRNYSKGTPSNYRHDIGADAKIALTSSLNLDLTVNPDFSQVDVDRQVTNLDRYELFFPERRQFFLENGDLFANFGYATIRPFFSRRIGLGVPIQYGARLSGKINKNWRVGAMDMQTGPVSADSLPTQNFATLAIQRKVFARSNIGLMLINKQSLNYAPDPHATRQYSTYNRNIGMEYNLASANNVWTGKMLFLKSFSPGSTGDDFVQAGHLTYFSRKWNITWQHEYVGTHYNAEVGYVPRVGYAKVFPQVTRVFFPKGGRILSHGPTWGSYYFYNTSFNQTDNETYLMYLLTFRSRSTLDGWIGYDYVKLLRPFDPTNTNKDPIAVGTMHRWTSYGMDYVSKPQRLLTWSASMRNGGYYLNGTRFSLTSEVRYRFQPYVSLSVNVGFNRITLPAPWNVTDLWLVSPRLDVTMTNKLFITAFAQYNNQRDNINLNTRLQWRYRPASDLFLVYTDNYIPSSLGVKDRAFVIKWTYWWSI